MNNITEKNELGLRLRSAREMAGLSQGQIAKKLGMHRPTISEIEAGRRNVKVDELKQFSNLYGVELSWLANNEVPPNKLNANVLAAARELSSMKDEDIDILIKTIGILKNKRK